MKNKALLVGINKYPNPNNALRGCVNDILDMTYFISEKNKVYAKENIKQLTDKQATKRGIVAQIKWLVEGAQAGNQLLFHYSGHGAQLPTRYPKLEKDGLDEIICPYDFDGTDATAMKDKEFAKLFDQIPKGVHFVWISDSCHAEDLSRDVRTDLSFRTVLNNETQYRFFQALQSSAIQAGNTSNLNDSMHYPKSMKLNSILVEDEAIHSNFNGALLSACASHQLSADAYIDKRFNGAFTHYLIKNLEKYGDTKSMEALIPIINKDLAANGYDQNPRSEGLLDHKTFFL